MDAILIEPVAVFVLGLIIGSFCNVVIYRLPLGQSIIAPGSHCRVCSAPILPWDHISVLSSLLLRGSCRVCKEPLSLRYPSVELVSGVLYVLLWFKFGFSIPFAIYAALASTLLTVALIDYDHKIIPN